MYDGRNKDAKSNLDKDFFRVTEKPRFRLLKVGACMHVTLLLMIIEDANSAFVSISHKVRTE